MYLRKHDQLTRDDACEVADVLLLSLFTQQATAAWIDPDSESASSRVFIERGHQVIARAVLDRELANAVVARLAFLCQLEIGAGASELGRAQVRVSGLCFEVLVTTRTAQTGLACEVRLIDEEGRDARSVATNPGGGFPAILSPGTRVGAYRVIEKIGKGGMGVVYLVEHKSLQKRFAMKVLLRSVFEEDPESAARFVTEARAAARSDHRGIVSVSDFGSLADGRAYLVMELLRGKSMSQLLRRQGALRPVRALRLLRTAASALAAAHSAGVVHRDLTPSNIFVEGSGKTEEARLVDFGAAKMTSPGREEESEVRATVVFGTPYYMAPEHAQGHPTDSRSDLYSLGCCFYEMLSGTVPFHASSIREILLMHILEPIPEMEGPHGKVPPVLVDITSRMMAKKPERRYQSADKLLEDLERAQAELT